MKKLSFWILALLIICAGLFGAKKIYKRLQVENVSTVILPKSDKMRFFSLDLHVSVIADLKNIFEDLGYELHNWNLSGHGWVFGRKQDNVEIVNAKTWNNLNPEMVEQFYEKYKDYLNQFDGFIVTHNASFALLYEKFNKPIIIVNSTRYENPFTGDAIRWKWLDDFLKKGVSEGRIFIVSNNKGDQHYLEYFTGIKSTHIPSLCLYTDAQYTGKNNGFILNARDHEVIEDNFTSTEFFQNKKLGKKYKWQDLYNFKGVVHFPYQISTMSIFEQYSANVPLFFPTKRFLKELHKKYHKNILSELSFYQVVDLPLPNISGNPNNVMDPKVLDGWIDAADFYDPENMPYIQYFDSFAELENLLHNVNLKEISDKMAVYNVKRKSDAIAKWQGILNEFRK